MMGYYVIINKKSTIYFQAKNVQNTMYNCENGVFPINHNYMYKCTCAYRHVNIYST